MNDRTMHGIVIGRTVELAEDPGLASGQSVEITLRPTAPPSAVWGDGLRRCAGVLADDWSLRDDEILEKIYQERKHDSRAELSE